MPSLSNHLLGLRLPPKIRRGPLEELDAYIRSSIETIKSYPAYRLAQGDDVDLLTVLDPYQDTLAFLHVLVAQLTVSPKKSTQAHMILSNELCQKVTFFIESFDPVLIRYSGREWITLMHCLMRMGSVEWQNQSSTTALVATAMLRLDPSCGTFTSTHVDLVHLCLETQTYIHALPIIDRDIYSLPRNSSPSDLFLCSEHRLSNGYITFASHLTTDFDRTDVLEYYLLGAMIYIAVKDWSKAQYFLEHVISTPSNSSATALMTEAYQKWLLVGLMRTGKPLAVPKVASTSAVRNLRSLAKPYQAVVDAFQLDDRRKLVAEVHEARQRFQDDGNLGLANDIVDYHQICSIRKLAKVYSAVPVERIARDYGSSTAEAEAYVQSLIADGQLRASIDIKSDGSGAILRFSQDQHRTHESTRSEAQSRDAILVQTRRIEALTVHVDDADRRLALSKEYLEYVRLRRRREENGEANDEMTAMSFAGRPPSEGDEDESMMTDVI